MTKCCYLIGQFCTWVTDPLLPLQPNLHKWYTCSISGLKMIFHDNEECDRSLLSLTKCSILNYVCFGVTSFGVACNSNESLVIKSPRNVVTGVTYCYCSVSLLLSHPVTLLREWLIVIILFLMPPNFLPSKMSDKFLIKYSMQRRQTLYTCSLSEVLVPSGRIFGIGSKQGEIIHFSEKIS